MNDKSNKLIEKIMGTKTKARMKKILFRLNFRSRIISPSIIDFFHIQLSDIFKIKVKIKIQYTILQCNKNINKKSSNKFIINLITSNNY